MNPPPRPPRGLSIDAAGTLLHPREPVWQVYAATARRHGGAASDEAVRHGLGSAMQAHRGLRGADAGWRAYWRAVVADVTACAAPGLFEELYAHYDTPQAWQVAPGAAALLRRVRTAGLRTVVVSNWDARLPGLLERLELAACFDARVVSALEGIEKPDPRMFRRAAARISLSTRDVLHVGDDPTDDVEGARRAGMMACHFGTDVRNFVELGRLLRARGAAAL